MYDMLRYLDHQFAPQGEGRLVVAATRHEDGTSGAASLEYHRQRGRLLRSLAGAEGVPAVERSGEVDAEYACETGYALVDIPVALAQFAGSIAGIISLWLSVRPRKDKDSVPGVRLELPGKTLIISGEITKKETRRLVKTFVEGA
jgi:hypothetical protein